MYTKYIISWIRVPYTHLPPLYNGRLIAIDGRWGQITSQAMLYISFIVSKGIPLLFSVFFFLRNNCFEVFGLFLWKEVSHSPIWLPPTFNIREEKAKPTRAFLPLLSMEMGHEENRGVGKFSSIFTKHGSKSPKRPHAGHAVVSRSVFPEEPTKRAVTPIGQHIFRRLFASWQRRKMTKHPFDLRFLKTMSFFVSIFGKAKTWSLIE